jgi:hypothetical protein
VIRSFALVLGASVLIAGCGGSSTLSADQLRSRATNLCAAAGRQANRIATPRSPAGAEAFVRAGIAVLTPELKQLKTLRAPDDLAEVYSTSITALSQKLRALQSAVREMNSGANPVTAMTALAQRLAPIETSEDGAWQALEIPTCMNHPSPA